MMRKFKESSENSIEAHFCTPRYIIIVFFFFFIIIFFIWIANFIFVLFTIFCQLKSHVTFYKKKKKMANYLNK